MPIEKLWMNIALYKDLHGAVNTLDIFVRGQSQNIETKWWASIPPLWEV